MAAQKSFNGFPSASRSSPNMSVRLTRAFMINLATSPASSLVILPSHPELEQFPAPCSSPTLPPRSSFAPAISSEKPTPHTHPHPCLPSLRGLGLSSNVISSSQSLWSPLRQVRCPPSVSTLNPVGFTVLICVTIKVPIYLIIFMDRCKDLEKRNFVFLQYIPVAHAVPNTSSYSKKIPNTLKYCLLNLLPKNQQDKSHQITSHFWASMFTVYLQSQLSNIENFSDILVKHLLIVNLIKLTVCLVRPETECDRMLLDRSVGFTHDTFLFVLSYEETNL